MPNAEEGLAEKHVSSSSAFDPAVRNVPGKVPPLRAKVHKQIMMLGEEQSVSLLAQDVTFRRLCPDDFEEIQLLHEEWFPVPYDFTFISRASGIPDENLETPNSIIGLAAVIRCHGMELLVGMLIMHIAIGADRFDMKYVLAAEENENLAGRGAYIMTLGVIDELRGRGIGSSLIAKAVDVVKETLGDEFNVLWLHVVSYNNLAIQMYLKAGFHCVHMLPDLYYLPHVGYRDSFIMGRYFGGGKPVNAIIDLSNCENTQTHDQTRLCVK